MTIFLTTTGGLNASSNKIPWNSLCISTRTPFPAAVANVTIWPDWSVVNCVSLVNSVPPTKTSTFLGSNPSFKSSLLTPEKTVLLPSPVNV